MTRRHKTHHAQRPYLVHREVTLTHSQQAAPTPTRPGFSSSTSWMCCHVFISVLRGSNSRANVWIIRRKYFEVRRPLKISAARMSRHRPCRFFEDVSVRVNLPQMGDFEVILSSSVKEELCAALNSSGSRTCAACVRCSID